MDARIWIGLKNHHVKLHFSQNPLAWISSFASADLFASGLSTSAVISCKIGSISTFLQTLFRSSASRSRSLCRLIITNSPILHIVDVDVIRVASTHPDSLEDKNEECFQYPNRSYQNRKASKMYIFQPLQGYKSILFHQERQPCYKTNGSFRNNLKNIETSLSNDCNNG